MLRYHLGISSWLAILGVILDQGRGRTVNLESRLLLVL